MKTTYAVAFTVDDCTESTRIDVIDTVSDWLADQFPVDERPPGTFVRARERSDDPVFRLSIDESAPGSTHTSSFTITIWYDKRRLYFDARSVSIPRGNKVMPMQALELPRALIIKLVTNVLATVKAYDANARLTPTATHALTELDGGGIAALINAAGRRLPVVVEVVDYASRKPSILDSHVEALAGIAHVCVIDTAEALAGFASYGGDPLLVPCDVKVYWAGGHDVRMLTTRGLNEQSIRAERNLLLSKVIDTAALALAAVSVPPPPIDFDDDFATDEETVSAPSVDQKSAGTALVEHDRDEVKAQYADYERQIAELQATVADADRIIAEQRNEIEEKKGQVDDLVLRNVHLETSAGMTAQLGVVATMKEALRIARERYIFLTFHDHAVATGEKLQGPQPMQVLQDLLRLNEVARMWQSGEIAGTSFALACRQVGLDFVAKIGQTAREKFAEDYEIEWRGRPVLAEAHIRRGKKNQLYRIHVYLDYETQQVVVAYIGRHLRGKRDSN